MTFSKAIYLLLICNILAFSACQDDPSLQGTAATYIPAGATGVVTLNPQQLMDKAGFENFRNFSFFTKMVSATSEQNPLIAQVMEQPERSGVDLGKPVFIAHKLTGGEKQQTTFMLFMSLRNVADFEKMFASENLEIKSQGDVRYITVSDGAILGWNENTAVALSADSPSPGLADELTTIFEARPKQSLADNRKFRQSQQGEHDISLWFSSSELALPEGSEPVFLALEIPPSAFKNNEIHAFMDFEEGRITGHADLYPDDDTGQNLMWRIFKKEQQAGFSTLLPGEGLQFAATAAIDIRGVDKIISERPQLSSPVENFYEAIGLSRREVLSTFGGDFLVAGYDNAGGGEPVMVFATNFKTEGIADAYLKDAVEKGMLREMEGGGYKFLGVSSETFSIRVNKGLGFAALKGSTLCFSKDKDIIESIQNGDATNTTPLAKSGTAQPVTGWVSAEMLGQIFPAEGSSFREMQFSARKNGADFILKTSDEHTNSLKTIFEKLDEACRQKENVPEKRI
ncbi:MAG: DUF4836 family protein [Saprospiraceae bacterium]